MAKFLEREIATGSLTGTYQELLASDENTLGNKCMLRNTTASRLVLRFGGDGTQIMTLEPGEKVIFGGISQFVGQAVDVKTDTSIPASIRLNLFE
jgi:hypothetical protein